MGVSEMRGMGVCVSVCLVHMMSGLCVAGGVTRVAPRGHAIRVACVVDVERWSRWRGMERDGEGWRGMERGCESGCQQT